MNNQDMIEQIDAAIGAHGLWKMRLNSSITTGRSDASPREVECDNRCNFGKWLYSDAITADHRSGTPYRVIKRLHAEFHTCAGGILSDAIHDRKDIARAKMSGEYVERSDKLVRALMKWKRELSA